MSSWPFRAHLSVGAVLALVYLVGGDVTRGVAYGLAGTCALAAILIGVRRQRPRPATAWRLIWAAVQTNTTGDAAMGLRTFAFPDSAVLLGVESLSYLLAYPFLGAALAVILRARSAGRDRGVVIDSAIVAVALGLPLWLVAVAPMLNEPGQPVGVLLVRLAFPLGDVALLTLLARLLAGGGNRNGSLRLLLAAVCGWLASDVANAVLAGQGSVQSYWGGALYCLSYTGLGASALHPSMPALTAATGAPASRLTTRRLTILAGFSLLAPALLLGQALTGRQVQAVPIGVACVVLFLLVVARMAGLTRQVEQQARELSDLAARDGLTGVGNRRAWDMRLHAAVAAAYGSGQPLTIALLDLDHFKSFNDAYGHQAGDQLLKGATAAWLDVLRRDDALYRYGGEEFGLILPGAADVDALRLTGRLGEVVPSGQSFSAGIASLLAAETADALVARADAALYRAKADGRARARLATAA